MVPIFRAPMRARDRDAPGAAFGLAHGLVGIGDAQAERMLHRFEALADGTFVWTRDADGWFHLGRIAGPLRRVDSPVGINHVRPTRWMDRPFAPDAAPAAVVYTFARGGRNFQRIHDRAAEQRTFELWADGAVS